MYTYYCKYLHIKVNNRRNRLRSIQDLVEAIPAESKEIKSNETTSKYRSDLHNIDR